MSLIGAMDTAISGLNAQSAAFSNISDNVANSQTVGYKEVDTAFSDLLTTSTPTNNASGSVVATPQYMNNVQGTVTQSTDPLALAISGQGMFPVSQATSSSVATTTTFSAQPYYTRAGDFSLNDQGYLVNSAGMYLNGWSVSSTGTVNQNAVAPIQVDQSAFKPVATSELTLAANLPGNTSSTTVADPISSQVTVYDGLGAAHTVELTWSQITTGSPAVPVPNQWQVKIASTDDSTSSADNVADVTFGSNGMPEGTISNVAAPAGSTVSSVGSFPVTNTMVADQAAVTAAQATASPFQAAVVADQQTVNTDDAQVSSYQTLVNTDQTDVTTATAGIASDNAAITQYTALVNTDNTNVTNQTAIVNAETSSSSTWTSDNALLTKYTASQTTDTADLAASNTSLTTNTTSLANAQNSLTADTASLNTATASLTADTATLATDQATLAPYTTAINTATATANAASASGEGTAASVGVTMNFGNGPQTIAINLGNYGSSTGLTQFSASAYSLTGLTQDGVPPGSFSSITTAASGDISVNYSNGETRVVARVPVVTFANPNALQSQNSQTYTATTLSGTALAQNAGTSGAGTLVTGSVEGSTVDIASQFSQLIVAQQAYSANTKLVTTADQLLQETINMKQ